MKKYTSPNGERITEIDLDELPDISPERLAEIEALRDEDIDFSDIPNMADDDDFWARATVGWPPPGKTPITIRLDDDVIAFFKDGPGGSPRGYQSRINAVLRSYMRVQTKQGEKKRK